MADETRKSMTEESFRKYRKALKPEIDAAKTQMHIAHKGYEDAVRSRQFKRCIFKKSEAALAEYEGLLNGVVTMAQQDATEINNTVNGYVSQVDTIKTAFDAVLASLRDCKKSLGDVESTAYALAEVVENSDQSEEKKWLKLHIDGFEKYVKDVAGDPKANSQGLADKTNDLADGAFEVAVKVAGINASINVRSLTTLSTQLLNDLTALKADLDTNIAFAQTEKTAAQIILSQQNQAQSTSRALVSQTRLRFAGLKNVEAYIRNPNCLEGDALAAHTRKELDEITRKIEQSFEK
jgi:hypothetical protein